MLCESRFEMTVGSNNAIAMMAAFNLTPISINLLVVYRESVNLIGYITRRLSADSLQLWIANENRLFWTRDACASLTICS
mgnify:CR=1 FL=1